MDISTTSFCRAASFMRRVTLCLTLLLMGAASGMASPHLGRELASTQQMQPTRHYFMLPPPAPQAPPPDDDRRETVERLFKWLMGFFVFAIVFNFVAHRVRVNIAPTNPIDLDKWSYSASTGEYYRIDDKGVEGALLDGRSYDEIHTARLVELAKIKRCRDFVIALSAAGVLCFYFTNPFTNFGLLICTFLAGFYAFACVLFFLKLALSKSLTLPPPKVTSSWLSDVATQNVHGDGHFMTDAEIEEASNYAPREKEKVGFL